MNCWNFSRSPLGTSFAQSTGRSTTLKVLSV
jgi:hypothetical protein